MFKKVIYLILLLSFSNSFAGYDSVRSKLDRGRIRLSDYNSIIRTLIYNGYSYAAIPWAKEYMASANSLDKNFSRNLELLIDQVGIKQFETMPDRFLAKSTSMNVIYIRAKKFFRFERYSKSLEQLRRISPESKIYPFALNMMATIYSIRKDQRSAKNFFEDCVSFSEGRIKRLKGSEKDQMEFNRDLCIAGIARSIYAMKDFEKSDLAYLDVQKGSKIWPNLLYDEAWNSYYKNDFNRSLGKLVTYKAPVMESFFNPEVDVLNALTYFRLCLFSDATKIVEDFYGKYLNPAKDLRNFILKRGKNYTFFYKLMARFEDGDLNKDSLLGKLLKVISKDQAYQEIRKHLLLNSDEFKDLRGRSNSRTRRILLRNSAEVLRTQKRLLGSYVRGRLVSYYADLYNSMKNMSFIKLEILSKRKERLYSQEVDKDGKRGDIKYLQRNEKQYFWDFNGEFWADELGDYVFALRSEC